MTRLLLLTLLPAQLIASDTTDVFVSGKGGYHTYRIPALAVTVKGTLLAFCEGRKTSREDLGDNDLLLKRSSDGGRTWGKMQLVYEEGGNRKITIGNPTVVVDEMTGVVWVVFLRNGREVLVTSSRDDGASWAKPTEITKQVKKPGWGFYAVGPGCGIQLKHGPHKGRIVIPGYHRRTPDKSGPSASHIFYSDDHGKSWQLGGIVGLHTNECQVVETLENGRSGLLLNARNHWARSGGQPALAGKRIIARSRDGGASWAKPEFDEALIEPTCQASLLRYRFAGKNRRGVILFANPADRGRRKVTVKLSYDEGRTWPVATLIHAGSSAYTALAVLKDGRVAVMYERDGYAKLTVARIAIAD